MSQPLSSPAPKIKVALICGGPSEERGISLNSARSILDHLSPECFEIFVYYVTPSKEWYSLPAYHLYSNSPSDFDFKLTQMGTALSGDILVKSLRSCDIAFPAIHGEFGEDGALQTFLEANQIPFVGPSSSMCRAMFSKHAVSVFLQTHGFDTLPSCLLTKNDPALSEKITQFFQTHSLERAIVKPDAGGSSIGVSSVTTSQEALQRVQALFHKASYKKVILEPFCEGREFTLVVLQSHQGVPVALIPTEIKISYDQGQFFDYRSKYLPTTHTELLCPPSFSESVILDIQQKAESLFSLYGLRDFVRIDGWVLEDGRILFTDFNPISGMEQNSFLFLQAAHVGMKHEEVLTYIMQTACARHGLLVGSTSDATQSKRRPVWVIFGGSSAERQVSVMSGTNVWLKLMRSSRYEPTPFFLDPEGVLWKIPYAYCLHHTAEEIYKKCLDHDKSSNVFFQPIRSRLGLNPTQANPLAKALTPTSLEAFMNQALNAEAFIFLALHGGQGENGTWQKYLTHRKLSYNGSREEASALCMDKFETGKVINDLEDPFIKALPKHRFHADSFINPTAHDLEGYWSDLLHILGSPPYIIKPQHDGCSSGIVPIESMEDLSAYMSLIHKGVSYIPINSFKGQDTIIELSPTAAESSYVVEPFLQTDILKVEGCTLVHIPRSGWLELTIGIFESQGIYHALNPSLTVSAHQVLNVEEKFQGGTGTNITPPPTHLISEISLQKIKQAAKQVAQALGIENYARIDCFFNTTTHQLIVIEANSLPALTPSTVLYHQALAEPSPLTPLMVLEHFIDTKTSKKIANEIKSEARNAL